MLSIIQTVRNTYRSLFINHDQCSAGCPKDIRKEIYALEDEIRDLRKRAVLTANLCLLREAAKLQEQVAELSKLDIWRDAPSYATVS